MPTKWNDNYNRIKVVRINGKRFCLTNITYCTFSKKSISTNRRSSSYFPGSYFNLHHRVVTCCLETYISYTFLLLFLVTFNEVIKLWNSSEISRLNFVLMLLSSVKTMRRQKQTKVSNLSIYNWGKWLWRSIFKEKKNPVFCSDHNTLSLH